MELIMQKEIFLAIHKNPQTRKSCISNEELVITIDTAKLVIASQ